MLNSTPFTTAGGQLTAVANTVLYVVGQGVILRLDPILVVNTDTLDRTFNLYVRRSSSVTPQRVTPKNMTLTAGSMYVSAPLSLNQGDEIQGDASVAAVLDYTINGMVFN